MTFKIAVLIKQVPDTTDIKWTAENTIQREGLDSIINPYDVGAIFLAKKIKRMLEEKGTAVEITSVSMGPNQAKEILSLSVAMGCDKAVLLCDKRFSGADTLATAYTLSSYIKSKFSDVDLIICGQQAIDGDTAQTPSSIAQKLNVSQITKVIDVNEANPEFSVWVKDTDSYTQEIKASYPLLVTTTLLDSNINCKIEDYLRAQNTEIQVFSAEDINADVDKIGFKGSPTIVKKAFRHVSQRNTELLENYSVTEFAEFVLNEIKKCKVNND